jgi:hypothetical protein
VIDFADAPTLPAPLVVLKTHRRTVMTLPNGPFLARETLWQDPATHQVYGSSALRRLVAPGCNFGYDVLVEVGRRLFLQAQPVGSILAELARSQVYLSASTVAELGRRFIVLLALAHRRCAARLQQAMALQGGYILHLDATFEDNSPMLMTGIDAVMEIVLGNIKLPGEKTTAIVPFLRQLAQGFGPPLALVHDMSKGILAAIKEVFPGVPDYICHFHFLRDVGRDLLKLDYDRLRKRLQTFGTVGRLGKRLRGWHKEIAADAELQPALARLLDSGWSAQALAPTPPLLAAYLFGHWIVDGLRQSHGYGFPFDRPLLTLALRARQVQAQINSHLALHPSKDWRRDMPFVQLTQDLRGLLSDYLLARTLSQLEIRAQVFEELRQALRLAPVAGHQGLNDEGQPAPMDTLQRAVQAFAEKVRARPQDANTPTLQKMLAQIEHYGPKLFAAPLVVCGPEGKRLIQPQRTNNLMERFFRDLKRRFRHKSGCHRLGRTLRTMLADTPLVQNLNNPEYVKILLDGRPNLEALFSETQPAELRQERNQAQQKHERIPPALKRLLATLTSLDPLKNLLEKPKSN